MKKLNDLRLYLLSHVAHLQNNPDCLHTWIDKGKSNINDGGYSFNNDYQIICLILNYKGEINKLLTPFVVWSHDNLIGKNKEIFEFETSAIDHEKTDVQIKIHVFNDPVIVNDDGSAFKECDNSMQNINAAIGN